MRSCGEKSPAQAAKGQSADGCSCNSKQMRAFRFITCLRGDRYRRLMDMRKIDVSAVWEPKVLCRERLDERRWILSVEAPFDMPPDAADLIGQTVSLDGLPFEIRGIVPRMPPAPIKKREIIELLVRTLKQNPA